MFIEQIDIKGFRGIKQLSLRLNAKSSVLIGENQWGKSSLISALKLLTLIINFINLLIQISIMIRMMVITSQ